MADSDGFKLPGSSYEELQKIIHAWGLQRGSSSNAQVGQAAGVDATTISRNNGFLEATGILSAGRDRELTTLGKQLAAAIDHQMEPEIAEGWRLIVAQTEFLQTVISAIRVRHGMDEAALTRHVAFSAGQKAGKATTAGVRTLIRILEVSGAIKPDGDTYRINQDSPGAKTSSDSATEPTISESQLKEYSPWTSSASHISAERLTGELSMAGPGVELSIRVNIDLAATPEDLETLGRKLAAFRKEVLSDPGDPPDPASESETSES